MKIYFANMFSVKGLEEYLRYKINILGAYPSFSKKGLEKPEYCRELFIDSGAFGKDREKIVLDKYVQFVQDNLPIIDLYANLDVIGNPRNSYLNLKNIERQGLNPLPVYHYKSPVKWLYRMLDSYDYIALGGLVPISGNYNLMRKWLDYVWGEIQAKVNIRKIKVHGFGIQNIDIMKRYPWHSVDSSSVHIVARYGGIYTPSGALKINPAVNSRELRWQVMRPKELDVVREHVEEYLDNTTFEVARSQTKEGILSRCAVSVHYLVEEFKDYVCIGTFKKKSNLIVS